MADPAADKVSCPEKIIRESTESEEAVKSKKLDSVASYDPRKLYIRETFDKKKLSDEKCSDLLKRKTGDNSDEEDDIDDIYLEDVKRRKAARYLVIPTPKKYLIAKGCSSDGSSVSSNQKTISEESVEKKTESPLSSYDSCTDSDTEL